MSDTTPPPPPGGPLDPSPSDSAAVPSSVPPPTAGVPMPPPPSAVVASPENGVGTASLILAILNFFCIPFIGAILGIILGRIGMKKAKEGRATNGGVAKAGFWVGIAGLVYAVIGTVVAIFLVIAGVAVVSDSLDKANNSKTGLADGNYGMNPNTSLRIGDRCAFGGAPVNIETNETAGSSVTIAGEGTTECGTGTGTPDVVLFTVIGGVAQIAQVG